MAIGSSPVGSGPVAGSAVIIASTAGTLAGTSSLNLIGQGIAGLIGNLVAVSAFNPTAIAITSTVATLTGVGQFNSNDQEFVQRSPVMAGVSGFNGAIQITYAASATLAGNSNFSGMPIIIGSTTANLNGTSSLNGYSSVTFGGNFTTHIVFLPNSYVSVETARMYLKEWDDFAIMSALQAATSVVSNFVSLNYLQSVDAEFYVGQYGKKILLNRRPINSVISVERMSVNRQTSLGFVDPGSYSWTDKFLTVFENTNYLLTEHLPRNRQEIFRVTYDAGYTVLPMTGYTIMPNSIAMATIETAKAILMARSLDFNVSGENTAGAYSMNYLDKVGNMPETARNKLQPYRKTAMW